MNFLNELQAAQHVCNVIQSTDLCCKIMQLSVRETTDQHACSKNTLTILGYMSVRGILPCLLLTLKFALV